MKTIAQLQIADFRRVDYPSFGYQLSIQIWGSACSVTISPVDDSSINLSTLLPRVKESLGFLDSTKKECFQAILDANMIKIAEDWIINESHSVENEGTRVCYLTEDDEKVYIPISQQEFLNSLTLLSIDFIFFAGNENPLIDLYFKCRPDYLLSHIILCRFNNSNPKTYKCIGLEG